MQEVNYCTELIKQILTSKANVTLYATAAAAAATANVLLVQAGQDGTTPPADPQLSHRHASSRRTLTLHVRPGWQGICYGHYDSVDWMDHFKDDLSVESFVSY